MFFASKPDWTERCEALVTELLGRFASQGLNETTFGLVALRDNGRDTAPDGFSWRADWQCYPCSLVKLFHLIHALAAIDRGSVQDHDELSRAMRDMILWSSNTAANYVIDVITETTGDTLLSPEAFQAWRDRREKLNRFFLDLEWPEFEGCNITQKLMDDVRYGREAQYAGPCGANLNRLTPLAAARLMHATFSGELPMGEAAHRRAQAILRRDRDSAEARLPHFQVQNYLGEGMPDAATLWSKAGHNLWTGHARTSYFKHDLIRVQMPDRPALTVCFMTQGKGLCEEHPGAFKDIGATMARYLLV